MSRRLLLLAAILVALLSPYGGASQATASTLNIEQFPAEVSIPNTRRIEFVSAVNGHRYSISVALPFERTTKNGYGVLYVLDGDFYFAAATEAARGRGNAPDGVVVVGIGYPTDGAYSRSVIAEYGPPSPPYDSLPPFRNSSYLERFYDLTPPTTDQELVAQAQPGLPTSSNRVGGLDDFLKIIETEVKPRVAELVPIDQGRQAIFGHSLGGLAVLRALFSEPDAFQTFIIASPSIWWNNKAVLADEPQFAAAVRGRKTAPRVLITMGSEEGVPPRLPPGSQINGSELLAAWRKARMVENARELVARLQAIRGSPTYHVEDYAIFDKQRHSIAAFPALARGISFAFQSIP